MNKLCVLFLIGAIANEAFGQGIFSDKNFRQDKFRGQNRPNPQITSTTASTITDGRTSTTLSPEIIQCIKDCPVTSEYNPVCGTNNVTYDNPGRFICAQWCGVDVSIQRPGRCQPIPV